MMAVSAIALLIAAVLISCIVESILGLEDCGLRYDPFNECMVFVPTKYDIMLEMVIRPYSYREPELCDLRI